jgi:hypothetical protein
VPLHAAAFLSRLALTGAILACSCAGDAGVRAQALEDSQAKATFLFNVAKFVEWPAGAEGPLIIGVAGDNRLADMVEALVRDRSINGRALAVRRLRHADDPAGSHLLFIAPARQRQDAEMLQRTHGPVLTVGETVQFLRDGGMVRLYVDNQRVRFQINAKIAADAGLKLHSQLLSLAAR